MRKSELTHLLAIFEEDDEIFIRVSDERDDSITDFTISDVHRTAVYPNAGVIVTDVPIDFVAASQYNQKNKK